MAQWHIFAIHEATLIEARPESNDGFCLLEFSNIVAQLSFVTEYLPGLRREVVSKDEFKLRWILADKLNRFLIRLTESGNLFATEDKGIIHSKDRYYLLYILNP